MEERFRLLFFSPSLFPGCQIPYLGCPACLSFRVGTELLTGELVTSGSPAGHHKGLPLPAHLATTHREYPSDPFMLKSEATSTICLVFYFFPFPCQLVGLLSPATIGGPASQESSVPAAVSPAAPVRPVPAPANRRKPP